MGGMVPGRTGGAKTSLRPSERAGRIAFGAITAPASLHRPIPMPERKLIRAVLPGTFDPSTNGHVDLIKRAAQMVDELIVAVGHNPVKTALFEPGERVDMLREVCAGMEGVRVEAYEGLTADFVKSVNAKVIIRGIRDNVDLHDELQQANLNLIV